MKNNLSEELINFIDTSPSSWHAAKNITEKLKKSGFNKLEENQTWLLKPCGKYYVTKNDSCVVAFTVPKASIKRAFFYASHTDSPALRIRPNPEKRKGGLILLSTEVYGGPLYSSWLNRDLGIAGRIYYLDKNDALKVKLINIKNYPLVIAQLAVHLDKEVNKKGLVVNPQQHFLAIGAMANQFNEKKSYFEHLLKKAVSYKKLLSHELFLYPIEKSKAIGYENTFISGYRIDNLISAVALLHAIGQTKKEKKDTLDVALFLDSEEIGSHTAQGAGSPFVLNCLERIFISMKKSREEQLKMQSESICFSMDVAHAVHPNYADASEPDHAPVMGEGIALKVDSLHSYATKAKSLAYLLNLMTKKKIPYQYYVKRADQRAGSSLGPIFEAITGIETIDIGCPELSMHSARELASLLDYENLCKLLSILVKKDEFFNE